MDWKTLAIQLAVMTLSMNKKTAAIAPYIGPAIATAESFPGKTGPQKLVIATDLVHQLMAATNAVSPGKVDVVIADEVIASSIAAVVAAANAFKKAGLIVTPKSPLPE